MKKAPPSILSNKEVGQVGRFGLVGILNTLVDFVVLNVLVVTILPKTLIFGSVVVLGTTLTIDGLVVAGIISGTLAMLNSYFFNLRFTFRTKNIDTKHTMLFFAVTIFGLYIIRPVIFKILTDVWQWPVMTGYSISQWLHTPLSEDFVSRNIVLAITILVVLVYNYLMYKYLVFKKAV